MAPQLIVLGWDAATFDVIDPLIAQGRLPALAALVEDGFRAPLRSTWPPMTDCAWTSAFTGVNPGTHGIFGSWYRAPGAYACRYFSSRDRRAPALWELGDDVRFLVWNVPMTFPPIAIPGAMVASYGAAPGADFCEPRHLQDELTSRWRVEDLGDRAPQSSLERFVEELIRGVRVQAEALVWAARRHDVDCIVAVWPHIDRAQHFAWRFRHTDHPLSSAIDRVYEATDVATTVVLDAFGDADVLIVSDHGAGRLNGDVNVGAWLARRGYATYASKQRSGALSAAAWRAPPSLRRLGRRFAPAAARRAVGATLAQQLGPFDWTKTEAFVGFHGDLWLNLEGREPAGAVRESRAETLLDELTGGLLDLRDPSTGDAMFATALKRDEIYSGPASHLAPDVILDSWSCGYRVSPSRKPSDGTVESPLPLAGVRQPWSSDHRPEGIFVARGPRIRAGRSHALSLYDVCPTALALLGASVPGGLDGRVVEEALDARWLERHPPTTRPPAATRTAAANYSDEEAIAVAAHLRELGYIE